MSARNKTRSFSRMEMKNRPESEHERGKSLCMYLYRDEKEEGADGLPLPFAAL
jgi:hypothetical protein